MSWPQGDLANEADAFLRRAWADGLTARAIAEMQRVALGDVVQRVHELGLGNRDHHRRPLGTPVEPVVCKVARVGLAALIEAEAILAAHRGLRMAEREPAAAGGA